MVETKYEYGRIINGDCLEIMDELIAEGVKVDCVITDLPYGTTSCKWDNIIPFEPMWEKLNKLIKDNGAICIFGNEPFTSRLINSNIKGFKYRWDWNKKIPSGMGYAKFRPMQQTEDISVFTKKGEKTIYNPQMIKRDTPIKSGGNNKKGDSIGVFKCMNGESEYKKIYDYKNPTTLIEFKKVRKGSIHPTQKPTELLEYLIKTYTNENELVLDITAGSMSLAQACINTNRNFICIEKDENYYSLGVNRISGYIKEM